MPSDMPELLQQASSRIYSTIIAPRAVFLLVSQSSDGISNIAPYSSVALVSNNPPMITVAFGTHDGVQKNTLNNIIQTKAFTVNPVPHSMSELANKSAEGLARVDDFLRLGLLPRPFSAFDCCGIKESPASIACEMVNLIDIDGSDSTLLIAKCVDVYVAPDFSGDGSFDSVSANVIASVGFEDFISVKGEAFTMPRTW
jgi:flavin reductase (DIM6/NTAB) family NADH-FMN oxidoreductase RutF